MPLIHLLFLFSPNMSARNMGKNDLWIAAAAHVIQATLLTTDKDFLHLDKTFFDVELLDIQLFM